MKLGGELGKKRDEKMYKRRYNTKRGRMAVQKNAGQRRLSGMQSKASRFRQVQNAKAETVADDLEAKQVNKKLTGEKGGEGNPLETKRVRGFLLNRARLHGFLCNAWVTGSTYKYAT